MNKSIAPVTNKPQKSIPLFPTIGMAIFIALLGALFINTHLNASLFLRLIVFIIFGAGIASLSSLILLKRFSFNHHFIISLLFCVVSYSSYIQASTMIKDAKIEREKKERELANEERLRKENIERERRKREYILTREKEIEIEKKKGEERKKNTSLANEARQTRYEKKIAEYNEYLLAKEKQDKLRDRMYEEAKIVSKADLDKLEKLKESKLSPYGNRVFATVNVRHALRYPLQNMTVRVYIYDSSGSLYETKDAEYKTGYLNPNKTESMFLGDLFLTRKLPPNYKWNFRIQSAEYLLPKGFKDNLLEEIPMKHKPSSLDFTM